MTLRTPAEVFPPGDFLGEELEVRGWTQGEFAEILKRDTRTVSEIINGKRAITPDMAKRIAAALGTSPEFWLGLENSYQLSRVRQDDTDFITRMAKLRAMVPLKDMIRRGWITESDNVEVLERQILCFFNIQSLDQEPLFAAAARRSNSEEEATHAQKAWIWRARQLARATHANKFDLRRIGDFLPLLHSLAANAEDIRRIPKLLAEAGIKFLLVQHLTGTKIDGACFWEDRDTPVIVLSLRFDRIDWFWYTLCHELGHVIHEDYRDGDVTGLDSNLDAEHDSQDETERNADGFAASFLIQREVLDDFIKRVRPLYSAARVEAFSKLNGIHPGITVGQLQHLNEIPYRNLRKMLVPVSKLIVDAALVDGWGYTPPSFIKKE